jgi:cytochrome c oxidase cbb3-type subunit 1
MWRATNADGTLTYSFVEALNATYPYYLGRLAGGLLVLAGMLLMGWNVARTWRGAPASLQVPVLAPDLASARA